MNHVKVAPEGLTPQECERNVGRIEPPIPYIPEKDILQEAVESSAITLKLTLLHKVSCVSLSVQKGPQSNSWYMSSRLLMPPGRKTFNPPLKR